MLILLYNLIIGVCGDIGSGKSCSLTRIIMDRLQKGYHVWTNFSMANLGKLKKQHHILEFDKLTDFDYWKKQLQGKLLIVIDEFHNVADSRRSMSKRNINVTQWIAQIRKVLKGNTANHLIISTQYLRQIDIRTQDLMHHLIECEFIKGNTSQEDIVVQRHYKKDRHGCLVPKHRTHFNASNVYPYFDTHELIDFGRKQ